VHRDLKLANVMLDDELDVRLVDFGLAKMIGCDLVSRPASQHEVGRCRLDPVFASTERTSLASLT